MLTWRKVQESIGVTINIIIIIVIITTTKSCWHMEQSLKFLVPNYNQNRDLTFGDRVEMRHFAPEEKKMCLENNTY